MMGLAVKSTQPEPGFYRARLVKGGPWVPVRMWWAGERDEAGDLMEDERLACEINGRNDFDFREQDARAYRRAYEEGGNPPSDAAPIDRVWPWCEPITESEYRYMIADAQHARRFRHGDPKARPDRRVDIARVPPEVLF